MYNLCTKRKRFRSLSYAILRRFGKNWFNIVSKVEATSVNSEYVRCIGSWILGGIVLKKFNELNI